MTLVGAGRPPKPRYIEALTSLRSSATYSTTKSTRPRKLSKHGCLLTEPNRCSSTRLSQACRWTIFNRPQKTRLAVNQYNSEQVITCRLHTDFRHEVLRRRLCTLNNSTGEVDCLSVRANFQLVTALLTSGTLYPATSLAT